MIDRTKTITIVGLGLLGGSYAKGFTNAGYRVRAVDIDGSAISYALEQGWIEEGSTKPSFVEGSDVVISCLYPHTFVAWMKENQKYLKSGSLLTDVTGVKRAVIDELESFLRKDVEYIACHPMAGREFRGVSYADEKRFENANYIIVPTEKNTSEAIADAREIAEILKFKHVAVLTPEEHDRMIGYLSQLTHVIAVSLMNASDNTHLAEFTGDSFRDLTRIANINEQLWPELFILNKDYLIREIDEFTDEIQNFKKMILEEDVEGMKGKLMQSSERRRKFDR